MSGRLLVPAMIDIRFIATAQGPKYLDIPARIFRIILFTSHVKPIFFGQNNCLNRTKHQSERTGDFRSQGPGGRLNAVVGAKVPIKLILSKTDFV